MSDPAELPDFDAVLQKSGMHEDPLTPLEAFILEHDPLGARSRDWRAMLRRALDQIRSEVRP